MPYLIGQIAIGLLVAGLIGLVFGWWLGRITRREPSVHAALTGSGVAPRTTSYHIEELEGVGKSFGDALRGVGIRNTQQLLERCSDLAGRRRVCESGRFKVENLQRWTSMADLMRISGVRGEFSELLEAANVDCVQTLAREDGEKLHARMVDCNQRQSLTRRVPSVDVVAGWIEQARQVPPMLTL